MESTPEGSVSPQPLTPEQRESQEQTQRITTENAANPFAPVNPFPEKKSVMETLKGLLSSITGKKGLPKKPDLPEPST